jgi:hypothetical protein
MLKLRQRQTKVRASLNVVDSARPYQSAVDRLRQLQDVTGPFFHENTARLLFHCSVAMLEQYIARWQKSGLIKRLGPRAGIFFNTLAPHWEHSVERAILTLYPGAVLTGVAALNAAGLTSQMPWRKSVIVPSRGPRVDEDYGYDVRPLPLQQYLHFTAGAQMSANGLPVAEIRRAIDYAFKVEGVVDETDLDEDMLAELGLAQDDIHPIVDTPRA